ncbi:hypothetical protein PCK2_000168 [Pneumocystis canis]|nr:hypothetical protein PCK2_000168 [Pneumocystis canis]
MDKRKEFPENEETAVIKRVKGDSSISLKSHDKQTAISEFVPRTSGLKAPIMQLTGHQGEIFASKFDPTGQHIASVLWNTYGDCSNYGQLKGHKKAVLDLQWSRDSRVIYSASADFTVGTWDSETGQRIRKHTGHEDIVQIY